MQQDSFKATHKSKESYERQSRALLTANLIKGTAVAPIQGHFLPQGWWVLNTCIYQIIL